MRQISSLILAGMFLLVAGCSSDIDPVEVRTDDSGEPTIVEQGAPFEAATDDLRALPVIFDARLDDDDQFTVELADVFDADVYVGPSDDAGDPHHISRARVVDEQDDTVWTQRLNSHYQLLEFLTPVIDEFMPDSLNVTVELLYQLVLEDYPEMLAFPAKVPVAVDGADRYQLEIRLEDGEWVQVAEYDIAELKEQARSPRPDADYHIEPLVDHGPPESSINVAILGDGYTEEEREEFEKDARTVSDRLLDASPIAEHADLFNVNKIWTPSNESGAGYDCNHVGADPDCEQDFRDTAFRTTFVIPAIADEYGFPIDDISDRVAMPLDIADIYEIAALAAYDEVIMIANSDKFSGFAGAYVAMVTNYDDRERFPDTAVHEVGHTLGLLGDEYYVQQDACYYHEPTIPLPVNIATRDDAEQDDDEFKWAEWVDDDTPMPTPSYFSDFGDGHQVGAFSPAYNCDFLVRPVDECMMKSSGEDFCPVCAQQMVRRFYSLIPPSDGSGLHVDVRADGTVEVSAPVRDNAATDRYELHWTVDGEPVDTDAETLQIDRSDLDDDQWTDISVTIRNNSEFLRIHDHVVESSFDAQIRLPSN